MLLPKCLQCICVLCQDHRSMARFIGYALYAAVEALKDASWIPTEPEERERTVISNFKSVIKMIDNVGLC